MKIVLAPSRFDSNRGYLEYYLATELTKSNHSVHVLSLNNETEEIRQHPEGFYSVNIPFYSLFGKYHFPTLKGFRRMKRFMQTTRPNILHCQPLFTPLSLLLILLQQLYGEKIVGSLISGGPVAVRYGMFNPQSIKSILKFIAAKFVVDIWIASRAGLYFALSKGIKRILLNHFRIPSDRIKIIPLGADTSLFQFNQNDRDKIRQQLCLSETDVLVTFAGRIVPSKEVDLLLKAMVPIIRSNPYAKLLIIGSGTQSYIDFLKHTCSSKNIEDNVTFHPPVHRTELPGFYSASDIAVWPGGPSITIVEAAAVGLPLIVKRSPFTHHLVSHSNGYSITPGDEKDLNEKLMLLIDDATVRKQMSIKSRKMVVNELNWVSVARLYDQAYRQLYCKE